MYTKDVMCPYHYVHALCLPLLNYTPKNPPNLVKQYNRICKQAYRENLGPLHIHMVETLKKQDYEWVE